MLCAVDRASSNTGTHSGLEPGTSGSTVLTSNHYTTAANAVLDSAFRVLGHIIFKQDRYQFSTVNIVCFQRDGDSRCCGGSPVLLRDSCGHRRCDGSPEGEGGGEQVQTGSQDTRAGRRGGW